MPELPEVETIARTLAPLVVGREISALELRCTKLRRPIAEDLPRVLCGRRIEAVGRRGKYLLLGLDNGLAWIWHMGMSGQLLHVAAGQQHEARRHDHVLATLGDGARLVFHDPRRFGLTVVESAADSPLFEHMGPEPLDCAAFDGEYLATWRGRTRRTLKDLLMDQRVVAGLGNIYVNEILFLCGLRPTRRASRLSRVDCDRMVDATRAIISEAMEHRGSSVSDFLDGIGRRGGYQWRHRVYARTGQPCQRCGTPIKTTVIAQRSSFYCPKCQR